MKLEKHVVEYEEHLVRRVRVGVKAGSPKMAERKVARIYQKGLALTNTKDSEVVSFTSDLDYDQEVVFNAVDVVELDTEFPTPPGLERPASLDERSEAAFEACKCLIAALAIPYPNRGPDLHNLQMAFEHAMRAVPPGERKPINKYPRSRKKELDEWLKAIREAARREAGVGEAGDGE